MVEANEVERSAKVIVKDDMLSLAIGRDGQNARLAARLTNWKIDVRPYSSYKKAQEEEEMAEGSHDDDVASDAAGDGEAATAVTEPAEKTEEVTD